MSSRPLPLVAVLGIALGGCGKSVAPATAPPPPRPSFVVIVADDMAEGLFGSTHRVPFLALPNLDRLAARGVAFDRAFVTTSLCSPSRASMLSGQYAHSHGVTTNEVGDLSPLVDTYPVLLQRAGYRTAFVGKWHMDSSTDAPRLGFDYWLSFRGQGVYEDPVLNENGHTLQRTGYITDILTDAAVQWLRGRGSEPFLLVLSHKAVHEPFHPAPRHRAAFPGAGLSEPPSFLDSFRDKPVWQRRYVVCGGSAAGLAGCPEPPPELPRWSWPAHEPARLDYMRTLLALDESVGSVVAALETQQLATSTYVIFISDNGFFLGEHRLGDKRLMYEDSIRVPLVIEGADLPAHQVRGLALNLDLAPTLLDLAGVKVPVAMQGRSLARVLRGEASSVREAFLYEYFADSLVPGVPRMVGIRTQQQTYVVYPALPAEEEFYDLDADPAQLVNLAAVPERAAEKLELRAQLERLRAETGAPP